MGIIAVITLIFILAALGIVGYFKMTPEGRKLDVSHDLDEANLQNTLVDTVEKTRKVQKELHERVEKLRK